MVKFDTNSWDNPVRLRVNLMNVAKLLLICCCINLFYHIAVGNWFLSFLNLMYLPTALILIISKLKYDKKVPISEIKRESSNK